MVDHLAIAVALEFETEYQRIFRIEAKDFLHDDLEILVVADCPRRSAINLLHRLRVLGLSKAETLGSIQETKTVDMRCLTMLSSADQKQTL